MRIAIVTVLVALAGGARADSAAEATQLFEDGLALQKAGKPAEACAKFARSYELDRQASRPAPGTQLNLGDCAERAGQLRRAYLLFDDAAREYERRGKLAQAALAQDPGSADARRDADRAAAGTKLARERADALQPRLAKLVVRLPEPRIDGLAVRIGDRAIPPAAEMVELLDAGDVAVSVQAPGRAPFATLTKVEAGAKVIVEVPALERLAAGDRATPAVDAAGPRRRGRVVLAGGLGAAGLVGLAISGAFTLKARGQYADAEKQCDRNAANQLVCPEPAAAAIASAGTKADVATYTGIAGALLVGGAIAVYVTAPREHLVVVPSATPAGAGVSVSGRF